MNSDLEQALRFLVVEDDPTSRQITARLLRRVFSRGEVSDVGSVAGASEILDRETFDCVLLDYNLSDGSAPDLLARLQHRGSAAPPVVVVSGVSRASARRRALALGAHDYLIKGDFNTGTLRRAIEAAIESGRARREAERIEHNSRELLNSLPLLVYVVDALGVVTYANRASRAGEAVAGHKFMWLVDAESHTACQEALFTVLREGGRQLLEVRFDSRRHLCQIARPPGQEHSAVVAALDVEERRRAEGALRILSAAVENTTDALRITDRKGNITYVNPAFEALTGYTRAEAVGQQPRILRSGKHKPAFYAQLWQTILSGETFHGTLWNRRKDGTLYQEELSISPIATEDGAVGHFVATGRDISERSMLEAQLRQAQKMEAVGRLAGGIAHDFNNILTTIITYTDFVRQSLPETDPRQDDLKRVRQASDSAARLTNQLLSFSRKRPLEPKTVNLPQTLLATGTMLGRTLGPSVEVVVLTDDDELFVRLDPGQLDQLLFNLAVNARDAMPDGGTLTMRLTREPAGPASTDGGRGHGCLRVTDTGSGMAEEVRERIFEPFFTTKGESGTGIGLSTCHAIVTQAGGCIAVDSELGSGTTFTIRFPLTERPAEGQSDTRADRQQLPTVAATALVVEDQPAILAALERSLQRLGTKVVSARSAEEARSLVQNGSVADFMITDVMLPGISGIDLVRQLRKHDPTFRVLLISGYLGESGPDDLPTDDTTAFLAKPFTFPQLVEKLEQLLASTGHIRRAAPAPQPDEPSAQPTEVAQDMPRESAIGGSAPESVDAGKIRRGRLLVVDDERPIQEALRRVLSRSNFDVQTASSGREAIAYLIADSRVDAVVCDVNMPDGSGIDLYEWVTQHRPDMVPRLLFLSGGEADCTTDTFWDEMEQQLMAKPIDYPVLLERVRALASRRAGAV